MGWVAGDAFRSARRDFFLAAATVADWWTTETFMHLVLRAFWACRGKRLSCPIS